MVSEFVSDGFCDADLGHGIECLGDVNFGYVYGKVPFLADSNSSPQE